eukprot:2078408-Prymnesium_polylepis.3
MGAAPTPRFLFRERAARTEVVLVEEVVKAVLRVVDRPIRVVHQARTVHDVEARRDIERIRLAALLIARATRRERAVGK